MNGRPPLWTWGAAIILAVLVLVSLLLLQERHKQRFFKIGRLERADQRPLIVAIGSSQTLCGLDFDSSMERRLSDRGVAAHFVRITGSNMSLADLTRFWKPLFAARPAIVIIEANTVRYIRASPLDWREELRGRLMRRLLWEPYTPANEDSVGADQFCQPEARGLPSVADYRAALSPWRTSSAEQVQSFISHVRALERAGTRVALLDLPRNPRAVPWFPASLRLSGDRVIERVRLETDVGPIDGLPPIGPEHFADTGHLRASGRKIVSDWLAKLLAQSLRRAP